MTTNYENSTQSTGSTAQAECVMHPEICKEDVPPGTTGTCNYYKLRYENYIERHAAHIEMECCKPKDEMHYSHKEGYSYKTGRKVGGCVAPDYYMNYGFKYCSAFKNETYEKLSSKGKVWLLKVLEKLQTFMEQGVVAKSYVADLNTDFNTRIGIADNDGNLIATNLIPPILKKYYTGIECRNDDFRDFAFATHPDAYNPKIMQTLLCSDLLTIANTPAYKEWLSWATWEQAIIMGENMDIGDITLGCLDEAATTLVEKTQEVFEDLAEHFTKW